MGMRTDVPQWSEYLIVAVEAARQAGARLVELFGCLQGYDLKTGHHDLVTEGDRGAEEFIRHESRMGDGHTSL
jgi:fructose-1,6-bisphosphatase/inositol monophosphatase family enzyme